MDSLPVILVVEDDTLVMDLVEDILEDGGFELVTAPSGQKALDLLESSKGTFRALIMDINLGPGIVDGWVVGRRARELDPDFPVIYMSGKEASDWASKGVPNSIILAKPFAPAQLITAISQLLNALLPG